MDSWRVECECVVVVYPSVIIYYVFNDAGLVGRLFCVALDRPAVDVIDG